MRDAMPFVGKQLNFGGSGPLLNVKENNDESA